MNDSVGKALVSLENQTKLAVFILLLGTQKSNAQAVLNLFTHQQSFRHTKWSILLFTLNRYQYEQNYVCRLSFWIHFQALTKVLGGSNPKLYSYQASLPRLPVPAVKDTVDRYLCSARPLLNDKEYAATKELSEEFLNTIANRLQRYLVLKSWWSSNYVSDW